MHYFDLMNRKAVGLGFAVFAVLYLLGLLIVGGDPSDTEMHLATWPAVVAGAAVMARIERRDSRNGDK